MGSRSKLVKRQAEAVISAPTPSASVLPRSYKKRVRLKLIENFAWKTRTQRNGLSKKEIAFRSEVDEILQKHSRPKMRSECKDGPRPCPWVSCRYHLGIDITSTGSLKVFDNWDDGRDTCAIDVAEAQGGMTLEQLSKYLYVTRERVRQLEVKALLSYRYAGGLNIDKPNSNDAEHHLSGGYLTCPIKISD